MKIEESYFDYQVSRDLLKRAQSFFTKETSTIPVMGIELEFFLFYPDNQGTKIISEVKERIISDIDIIAKNHGLKIGKTSLEVGFNQFEVNLKHSDKILELLTDFLALKEIIIGVAASYKLIACFDPKPMQDEEVGSGLHLHLSLWDKSLKKNLFAKEFGSINSMMLHAIAGLLDLMKASFIFFVNKEEDFSRFKARFSIPKEQNRYLCSTTNAPTNISWGMNNRTTAIRIPDANQDDLRIEHRVPASSANSALVMSAILMGAFHGIKNQLMPMERIWGNAFDSQYKLDSFPVNLEEAKAEFQNSILKTYLENL